MIMGTCKLGNSCKFSHDVDPKMVPPNGSSCKFTCVAEDVKKMEGSGLISEVKSAPKSISEQASSSDVKYEEEFRPFANKIPFTCVVEDVKKMESSGRISEVKSAPKSISEQVSSSDVKYEEEFRPFANKIPDEDKSNTETIHSLLRELAISSTQKSISSTQKDQLLSLVGSLEKDLQKHTKKRGFSVLVKDHCLHYMMRGWCGLKNTCKFSHELSMENQRIWFLPKKNRNTHRCLHISDISVSVNSDLRNTERNFRPISTKDRCPNHMIRGICKFGDDCKQSHDISIANLEVCHSYNNDGSCKHGNSCKNLHALVETKNPKTCNNKNSTSTSSVDEGASNMEVIDRFLGLNSKTKSDDQSRSTPLKISLQKGLKKDQSRPINRQCMNYALTGRCHYTKNHHSYSHNLLLVGHKICYSSGTEESPRRYLHIPEVTPASASNIDDRSSSSKLDRRLQEVASKRKYNILSTKGRCVKHMIRGTCKLGGKCRYLHDISIENFEVCHSYNNDGSCKNGNSCRNLHVLEENVNDTIRNKTNVDEDASNMEAIDRLLGIKSPTKSDDRSKSTPLKTNLQKGLKKDRSQPISRQCMCYTMTGRCNHTNNHNSSHNILLVGNKIRYYSGKKDSTRRYLHISEVVSESASNIEHQSSSSKLDPRLQKVASKSKYNILSTEGQCVNHIIKGSCKFGDDCKYSHDISIANREVCHSYNNDGSCKNGNSCKNLHALVETKNPKTCNNKKSPSPSSVDEDASNMEAIDRFLGIKSPTKSDEQSRSIPVNTNPIRRQCVHYMMGADTHNENCKHSHDLLVKNGNICFKHVEKDGNPRKYLHIAEGSPQQNLDNKNASSPSNEDISVNGQCADQSISSNSMNLQTANTYRIITTVGRCINHMIRGTCKLRGKCRYLHDISIANMEVCHTYNNDGSCENGNSCRNLHALEVNKPEEEPCAICLENMSEKPVEKRIFGILQNCKHVFCVECIKKWRETNNSCPYCRVTSNFVLHSRKWIATKEEKEKAIKKRKGTLTSGLWDESNWINVFDL